VHNRTVFSKDPQTHSRRRHAMDVHNCDNMPRSPSRNSYGFSLTRSPPSKAHTPKFGFEGGVDNTTSFCVSQVCMPVMALVRIPCILTPFFQSLSILNIHIHRAMPSRCTIHMYVQLQRDITELSTIATLVAPSPQTVDGLTELVGSRSEPHSPLLLHK
jgi:hypothetical protein